ncbi:ribbon-helix-helix protein, CopG family [Arthrobacter sp. ERGS1:01]|nr:ribbon-helix-helix protein, CopG family [Arthrobacter sp. ERGS1:01]
MRQIDIRLPESLISTLDQLGAASGLSRAATIRTLLAGAVASPGTDDE